MIVSILPATLGKCLCCQNVKFRQHYQTSGSTQHFSLGNQQVYHVGERDASASRAHEQDVGLADVTAPSCSQVHASQHQTPAAGSDDASCQTHEVAEAVLGRDGERYGAGAVQLQCNAVVPAHLEGKLVCGSQGAHESRFGF